MGTPRYYPCRVRLDGCDRFVAWYTAEHDGFARHPDGRLVVAATLDGLDVPWTESHLTVYDFDRVQNWCETPEQSAIDCPAFLDAWNFLDDLAEFHAGARAPYTRASQTAGDCYNRLFWSNNPPAITPPGERFVPSWSAEDLVAIREVFETGFGVLRSELAGLIPGD